MFGLGKRSDAHAMATSCLRVASQPKKVSHFAKHLKFYAFKISCVPDIRIIFFTSNTHDQPSNHHGIRTGERTKINSSSVTEAGTSCS